MLQDYQNQDAFVANGLLGMLPRDVAKYFREKGYTVIVTYDTYEIDLYSQFADANILWYAYESDSFPWVGAHFVFYEREGAGYKAYNVGTNGVQTFDSPSDYASWGSRFWQVGIFIFV